MKNIVACLAVIGLLFNNTTRATDDPSLMEPAKSVYDHYLKIQIELTKDSLKGVGQHGRAIAKAIREDETKALPSVVAEKADDLAKAQDLAAAREAFKSLSKPLIQYLANHKVHSGLYHEAFCPMANASWLQAGTKIGNPYLGKSMPTCGEIKRDF